MNPIHILQIYFPKIHFNIILGIGLGLPSGLFPSGFPTTIFYAFLTSSTCATGPAHLTFLDLFILITRSEEEKLCNFLQPHITSFLLGPNFFLSSINLCSSLNVRDHNSHTHTHKTGKKYSFVYFNFYTFK
jgi:hypothetical protein